MAKPNCRALKNHAKDYHEYGLKMRNVENSQGLRILNPRQVYSHNWNPESESPHCDRSVNHQSLVVMMLFVDVTKKMLLVYLFNFNSF